MPKVRSPLLGFNHNLRHGGRVFHVQTEDSGSANPRIFTHLFHDGVIIATKKHEYGAEADADIVKSLMQAQHKAVLRELKHLIIDDGDDEYAQIIIDNSGASSLVAGTLEDKEEEDELDVSGAFRRISTPN